jgi:hypothetical protein
MRYGIRIIAALGLVALLRDGGRPAARPDRPARRVHRRLDLGSDLKIHCIGNGRVQKRETDAGVVYSCAGRTGGEVVLFGSHVKFRGFATHYKALLPPVPAAPGRAASSSAARWERSGGSPNRSPLARATRSRPSRSSRACLTAS